jgi:WD40 repeat protein
VRDGQLIVVGGSGHTLSVWRFDSKAAYQELKVKVNQESNFVDAVAISKDSLAVAYSAACTRRLRYDGMQWQFEPGSTSQSTALCFSEEGRLYRGGLNGFVSTEELSINVGFPVFKLAISTNGQDIAVGGLGQIVILPSDLSEIQQILPNFGSPFSTFEFEPRRNRLFVSTVAKCVTVYDIRKQHVLTKMRAKFGKQGGVAMNTILFDPQNPDRVIFASSHTAIMKHMNHPELPEFRFPYKNILFVSYPNPGQIVIFEKPWIFMINSLPQVVRTKRFLTKDEEQWPRY